MARSGTFILGPSDSLTVVAVTDKMRRLMPKVYGRMHPEVTYVATHYKGSKKLDTREMRGMNYPTAVVAAKKWTGVGP